MDSFKQFISLRKVNFKFRLMIHFNRTKKELAIIDNNVGIHEDLFKINDAGKHLRNAFFDAHANKFAV